MPHVTNLEEKGYFVLIQLPGVCISIKSSVVYVFLEFQFGIAQLPVFSEWSGILNYCLFFIYDSIYEQS